MKRIIYTMVFLLLAGLGLRAGNDNKQAAADFARIKKAYEEAPALSMDVFYKLYNDHLSSSVLEEHKGFYSKKGLNMYAEVYGTLTIQNKDMVMVKDDSSKVLMLSKPTANVKPATEMDLEKLLALCSSVSVLPAPSEGVKGYRISFGEGEQLQMKSVDIFFDVLSYLPVKVILFYNTKMELNPVNGKKVFVKPRFEISYRNISTADIPDEQFSTLKYIKKNGSSWKVQPSFKEYELLDQTLNR